VLQIAVTGSIATDHLMVFPGRFTDQLIGDQLDKVSLSFLVDRLEIRRGGVAANIAYGMAGLGLTPILVGSAGTDFGEHLIQLKELGVDTDSVWISTAAPTARFTCTTDLDMNQIASFYTGAMAEARNIQLKDVVDRTGAVDLVLVSPNDPEAMLRHTAQSLAEGIPFAADPSQQLATVDRVAAQTLVDGATWLFTNEYEASLLTERTGWTREHVLDRVGTWVTTLADKGVRLDRAGEQPLIVPAVPTDAALDPTGVGDAFRAGFFSGQGWGLDPETSARLGCAVATTALEVVGPEAYEIDTARLTERLRDAYGDDAVRDIVARLERL
jgi:adenosine kinase